MLLRGWCGVYFILKVARFLIRLLVKPFLWPIKLAWRLLTRRRSDDDGADWADIDSNHVVEDEVGSESNLKDDTDQEVTTSDNGATGAATSHNETAPTAASTAAVSGLAVNKELNQFRRVVLGTGVISGVSAVVSLFGLGYGYSGISQIGWLALNVLAPILIVGACARGLRRQQSWAWYSSMAWGSLVILTYFLRGALPRFLLAPFAGGWLLFGNLGAVVAGDNLLYNNPLRILSVVIIGGLVLLTGFRARPKGWSDAVRLDQQASVANSASSGPREEDELNDSTSSELNKSPTEPKTVAKDEGSIETSTTESEENTAALTAQPDETIGTERSEPDQQSPTAELEQDDETSSSELTVAETNQSESDGLVGYQDKLTANNPAVRRDAVRALSDKAAEGALPEQEVIDALVERLKEDDDTEVRVAACEALRQFGTGRNHVMSVLEDYRLDPDSDVSRAASRAIRELE